MRGCWWWLGMGNNWHLKIFNVGGWYNFYFKKDFII